MTHRLKNGRIIECAVSTERKTGEEMNRIQNRATASQIFLQKEKNNNNPIEE